MEGEMLSDYVEVDFSNTILTPAALSLFSSKSLPCRSSSLSSNPSTTNTIKGNGINCQLQQKYYQEDEQETGNKTERILWSFGDQGLRPSDELIAEGKKLCEKIKKRFLDRSPCLGVTIIVKGMSILLPEMAVILWVRKSPFSNQDPPTFGDLLEEIKLILQKNFKLYNISPNTLKKTRSSVQFNFRNGVKVEVLPGVKLPFEEIQNIIAREYPIATHKYYRGSLLEKREEFMQAHNSSFVESIVRLVKFWFLSQISDSGGEEFISGGVPVIQLIAVAAALQEKFSCPEKPSILFTLRKTFEMVCNLKKLKLSFRQGGGGKGKWEVIWGDEITSSFFIRGNGGDRDILMKDYYIVDPVNPFNDLLEGRSSEFFEGLHKFALKGRKKVSGVISGKCMMPFEGFIGEEAFNILKLLEQPSIKEQLSMESEGILNFPKKFEISFAEPSKSAVHELRIIKETKLNEILGKDNKDGRILWAVVEAIKWQILSSVAYAMSQWSLKKLSTNMKYVGIEMVKEVVKLQLEQSLKTELNETDEDLEENMDVVLTVPYKIDGDIYAVKLSMFWGD